MIAIILVRVYRVRVQLLACFQPFYTYQPISFSTTLYPFLGTAVTKCHRLDDLMAEMRSLRVLGQKAETGGSGWLLLRPGDLSRPVPTAGAAGSPWYHLACGHITPISAFVFTWCLPVCMSVPKCPLFIRGIVILG